LPGCSPIVLHAPGFTLRGGTNEILRGVVARGWGCDELRDERGCRRGESARDRPSGGHRPAGVRPTTPLKVGRRACPARLVDLTELGLVQLSPCPIRRGSAAPCADLAALLLVAGEATRPGAAGRDELAGLAAARRRAAGADGPLAVAADRAAGPGTRSAALGSGSGRARGAAEATWLRGDRQLRPGGAGPGIGPAAVVAAGPRSDVVLSVDPTGVRG